MDMRFEKGEKKFGIRQTRTRVDRVCLAIYATETEAKLESAVFSVD